MRYLTIFLLFLVACVEPTQPEFQLEDPFYLVEGEITDREEFNEIRVRRSNFREVQLTFEAVTDAVVLAVEGAGPRVQWIPVAGQRGVYRPPSGFSVRPGERWSVRVEFPDGTVAASNPEPLPSATRIDDLSVQFDPEGRFDESRRRFLPAFDLLLDFSDPPAEDNYFEWRYRYWEQTIVCATCECGVYQNGRCVAAPCGSAGYFDYLCESTAEGCYRITEGKELQYASDRIFAGGSVEDQSIGNIEFTDYGGLLVEAVQYGISEEAYQYGKVITEIIEGSSGLNATIPAALNGNLRNTDPEGPDVLGNVRVASVATRRYYFVRDASFGNPDPPRPPLNNPPIVGASAPPRAPCALPGFTPERPEGWPE